MCVCGGICLIVVLISALSLGPNSAISDAVD